MALPCILGNSRRRSRWPHYQHESDQAFAASEAAPSPWPTIALVAPHIASRAEIDPRTPLVSQAALAARLNRCVATVARERKKGLLAAHKIGGQWMHSEQQIADYLKRTETPLRLYGKKSNDNEPL